MLDKTKARQMDSRLPLQLNNTKTFLKPVKEISVEQKNKKQKTKQKNMTMLLKDK